MSACSFRQGSEADTALLSSHWLPLRPPSSGLEPPRLPPAHCPTPLPQG